MTTVVAKAPDMSWLTPGRRVVRLGPATFLLHQRSLVVALVLAAALAVAAVASLCVGETFYSPTEVVGALFGQSSGPASLIVDVLRGPRILTGILAGAAFGLAGALIQTVARNPLASPDYIGVTHGAGAAAVAIIIFGFSTSTIPLAAGLGGAAAALIVWLLAWRHGLHAGRFLIVGVAVSFALHRLTDLLLTQNEVVAAQQARIWLAGTVNGRGFDQAWPILLVLVVTLPLLVSAQRGLRSCGLTDDIALGLGTRLGRVRLGLVALGVAYAAVATSAVGPVEFVALMSPQVARRLARTPEPPLVSSALFGALLVTVADLVARRAFSPLEVPVGVITAVLGAPYLLWLLVRTRFGAAS
jgi:iron complex transport system permease protein